MSITKKQAIAIAIKEGKVYRDKLANTSLLLIYRDTIDHQIHFIELEFSPDNYQHLTGLVLTKKNKDTGEIIIRQHTALEFYNRCIRLPYITESEIAFQDEKTIDAKMMALPYITQMIKITKMIGEYNKKRPHLECDYIIGGIKACMGISKYQDRDIYYPRSCLYEDIRKITTYTSPVLAIFQKPIDSRQKYTQIRYVAKGLNLFNLNLPTILQQKISLEEYRIPITKSYDLQESEREDSTFERD